MVGACLEFNARLRQMLESRDTRSNATGVPRVPKQWHRWTGQLIWA